MWLMSIGHVMASDLTSLSPKQNPWPSGHHLPSAVVKRNVLGLASVECLDFQTTWSQFLVLVSPFLIHLMYLRSREETAVVTQVAESVSLTQETQNEFTGSAFLLAMPQWLQPLEKWPSEWHISVRPLSHPQLTLPHLFLSLSFYLSPLTPASK